MRFAQYSPLIRIPTSCRAWLGVALWPGATCPAPLAATHDGECNQRDHHDRTNGNASFHTGLRITCLLVCGPDRGVRARTASFFRPASSAYFVDVGVRYDSPRCRTFRPGHSGRGLVRVHEVDNIDCLNNGHIRSLCGHRSRKRPGCSVETGMAARQGVVGDSDGRCFCLLFIIAESRPSHSMEPTRIEISRFC